MTVENVLRKNIYITDGLTSVFVFGFAALSPNDIKAELDVGSGLVPVTDFTVSLNVNQTDSPGGVITFDADVPVGTLIVLRDVIALQNTKFGVYSRFPSGTIEASLDLLTMLYQQLDEENNRSLKLSIADEGDTSVILPPYEADRIIGWDPVDKKLANKLLANLGSVVIGTGLNEVPYAQDVTLNTTRDNVASLKAIPNADIVKTGQWLKTKGYYNSGDGGYGDYLVMLKVDTDALGITDYTYGNFIFDNFPTLVAILMPVNGVANVLQFGVTGNGITVDTVAMQAALNNENYKLLLVPEGTYLLDDFTIPSGTTLKGVDKKLVRFNMTTGVSATSWIKNTNVDLATSARLDSDIEITGITFDGSNRVAERWLQNPDTLATITDPENDYYDVTTNPTGKIGGPTFIADPDGILLSSTPSGAGSLVFDGVLQAGGVVDMSIIGPRKVSLTSAGNVSSVSFTVTGTDGDDAALVEVLSGPNNTTVFTAAAFKTVTDISIDAGTVSAIEVGVREYDIFSAVEEKRRNKNYLTAGVMISLRKVDNCHIHDCVLQNHNGHTIVEQGGKDILIEDNLFDTVGKNDHAYPVIWTQSFTSVGGGNPGFQDSENIRILNNTAKNIERSFCLFSPSKGGQLDGNIIDGWGESCIFINAALNANGGRSYIRNNKFSNGVLTDIAGNVIEAGAQKNLTVSGNYMKGSGKAAMTLTGTTNFDVHDNTLEDCFTATEIPYGPFSERYALSVNSPPIAGDIITTAEMNYIGIGSVGSVGGDGLNFHHNTILETRAFGDHPDFVFRQTKSGSNNIAGRCDLTNNIMDIPSTMEFIDVTTTTGVWKVNIPLKIKDNINHVSESPVVISHQFPNGTTGVVSFDVGFRPSSVHIIAANNVTALGQSWTGFFSWNEAAVRNDVGLAVATDSSVGQQAKIQDQDVIRIQDTAAALLFKAEFTSWRETGFQLNVVNSNILTDARFICYP